MTGESAGVQENALWEDSKTPLYLKVAQWVQEQPRWVSVSQIMRAFGLSRTQAYTHIVAIRKKFPGCMEERRENKGMRSVISVRMIEGWSMPTRPVQTPLPTCHFLSSIEGMVMPVPQRHEHCCWLQLTQRSWDDMHLSRREVEQALCITKSIKEGVSGSDNQGVSDISGCF